MSGIQLDNQEGPADFANSGLSTGSSSGFLLGCSDRFWLQKTSIGEEQAPEQNNLQLEGTQRANQFNFHTSQNMRDVPRQCWGPVLEFREVVNSDKHFVVSQAAGVLRANSTCSQVRDSNTNLCTNKIWLDVLSD